MSTQQKKKNTQTWLMTLILCSAAVGYVFLVFLPGQKAIGKTRKELREKQLFILQETQISLLLQQAQEDIDAAQQFIEQWQANSPSEEKLSVLFGAISDQARLANINVVKFDPQAIKRLDTIWQMDVTVGFEGEYAQAFDFLKRIEQLQKSTWITEVSLSTKSKDSQSLQGTLVLTIFADNYDFSD